MEILKEVKTTFIIIVLVHFISLAQGNSYQMIDLSYPYDENTAFWPTDIPFSFIEMNADDNKGYWYASNEFKTAEHCGTHIDAPYHFNENGWKVSEIPLQRLITTGVFVNASLETNGNCSYKLPSSKLVEWENKNGPFPNNSIVLISFNWASKYHNKTEYFGTNELCLPGLSKEAAEWITNKKKIVGVGVDSASIDQGGNVEVHIELTSHNIFVLENVAITKPLPNVFKIVALPMKIKQGTGGPCRVIVII